MSKRPLQWLAALSLLGLLAGACSNGSTSTAKKHRSVQDTGLYPADVLNKPQHVGTPRRGGTVTFGLEAAVLNYSPNNKVIQPSDLQVESSVFDSLITSDDHDLSVLDNTDHKYNQLADSLKPSKDLKTWTLKLRPGIKFSNGDPLTAEEVVKHTQWIQVNATSAAAPRTPTTSNRSPLAPTGSPSPICSRPPTSPGQTSSRTRASAGSPTRRSGSRRQTGSTRTSAPGRNRAVHVLIGRR